MQRSITAYDPHADAAERWPEWSFHFIPLRNVTARFSTRHHFFLFDADYWAGREDEAIATAVAHLDLGTHQEVGNPTEAQVAFARTMAQMRLDRPEWRPVG